MPVIIPKAQAEIWLNESADVLNSAVTNLCIRHIPKEIDASEQISLFD
jgi:hypothetical protein